MPWKNKTKQKAYNKQYRADHAVEIAARKKAKYQPHPKQQPAKATKRPVSALSPRPFETVLGKCPQCQRENQILQYGFCLECRVLGAT